MESLGIPLFREIGVEVDPPISPVELELDHSKNQLQQIGIVNWSQLFSNDWINPTEINYSMGANPFGVCVGGGVEEYNVGGY